MLAVATAICSPHLDHSEELNVDHGIQTYGTEYVGESAKAAAGRGVEVIPGGLTPQLPNQINGFDAILFTEVIEHINNPLEIASHFFGLLKPGGLFYITTPNSGSIESRSLGPDWGIVMYPEHLCYYTPETLHRLLRQAGFQKISVFSKNISFFRLAQYWSNKHSKKLMELIQRRCLPQHRVHFIGMRPCNSLKK
jgi:SAM-dependent methyltransferase